MSRIDDLAAEFDKGKSRNGHFPKEPPPDFEQPEGPIDLREYGDVNEFTATANRIAEPLRQANAAREPGEDPPEPEHKSNCVPPEAEHNSDVPPEAEVKNSFNRFTFRQLRQDHPKMHEPIIGHLLRVAETLNVISVSKIGKSWLMYGLLLCIVTGRPWLGRFPCKKARALLVDNELHKPTLAFRIKTVADAMGIHEDEYADNLEIWAQRGNLRDIFGIVNALKAPELKGYYGFIAIDAKYRALPAGVSENDNDAAFYNVVDGLGMATGAGTGLVHHSTKGSQTEKRVTDVGAGGGVQSRAADCHLILREHEDDNAVVLDAAVRSFAPIEPIVLRWNFPLWIPDEDADPTQLKGKKSAGEEKQSKGDAEADELILRLTSKEPMTRQDLKRETGYGYTRLDRCIRRLRDSERLTEGTVEQNGKQLTAFSNRGGE